jgi:hypothetical protein
MLAVVCLQRVFAKRHMCLSMEGVKAYEDVDSILQESQIMNVRHTYSVWTAMHRSCAKLTAHHECTRQLAPRNRENSIERPMSIAKDSVPSS